MPEREIFEHDFPEMPLLEKSKSLQIEDFDLPVLKKYLSDDVYLPLNFFEREDKKQEYTLEELPFFAQEDIPEEHVVLKAHRVQRIPDRMLLREFPFYFEDLNAEIPAVPNPLPVPQELQIPAAVQEVPVVPQIPIEGQELDADLGLFILFEEGIPVPVRTLDELMCDYLKEAPFYSLVTIEPHSHKCQICVTKKEDYHHLGCDDKLCNSCITLLLHNYIDTSYVFPDEIICPLCTKSIPDEIIKKFAEAEAYEKMLKLRESLKVQKLVSQNKAFYCPKLGCEGYAHLITNEKISACITCKTTICNSCKNHVHVGITCEEAKELTRDTEMEEFLLGMNWRRCPTCGSGVEKIEGCQFITCQSPVCKGKNALCYLCGRFVIEAQHFSHYKTKGPFGDTCNTFDGIPEDVDPTTLAPIIDLDAPYVPQEHGGEEE